MGAPNGTQFEMLNEIKFEALKQENKIHGSLYPDPQIFEEELGQIFCRVWVFVGDDSETPNPGN